jgi:hypothetical protein
MDAGGPSIPTPTPRRISDPPSLTSQAWALFARLWTYALVNQTTHMPSDVEDWVRDARPADMAYSFYHSRSDQAVRESWPWKTRQELGPVDGTSPSMGMWQYPGMSLWNSVVGRPRVDLRKGLEGEGERRNALVPPDAEGREVLKSGEDGESEIHDETSDGENLEQQETDKAHEGSADEGSSRWLFYADGIIFDCH